MGRLHIAATAYPYPSGSDATLVVSVSDDQGNPVTGLAQTHFKVQVVYGDDTSPGQVTQFNELVTPSGLPGIYYMRLSNLQGVSIAGFSTFVINVQSGKGIWLSSLNQGWTVVGFGHQ
jgi:hypothetical protein